MKFLCREVNLQFFFVSQVETKSLPLLIVLHGKGNYLIRQSPCVQLSWLAEQRAGWDVSAFSTKNSDKEMSLPPGKKKPALHMRCQCDALEWLPKTE